MNITFPMTSELLQSIVKAANEDGLNGKGIKDIVVYWSDTVNGIDTYAFEYKGGRVASLDEQSNNSYDSNWKFR